MSASYLPLNTLIDANIINNIKSVDDNNINENNVIFCRNAKIAFCIEANNATKPYNIPYLSNGDDIIVRLAFVLIKPLKINIIITNTQTLNDFIELRASKSNSYSTIPMT